MSNVNDAIDILNEGGVIGLPTETVYGLGGDATNAKAIASIYAMKGRPHFNPLIVHGYSPVQLSRIVTFNEQAKLLARAFWPGPLTLVLPRQVDCQVDLLAGAGLPTLAVRIPSHPLALELLEKFQRPVVAPSANLSNHLSPTTKAMVSHDFPSLFVLDGRASVIGLESTIIGFDPIPTLLRPGGIPIEQIEEVLRYPLNYAQKGSIQAPGMLAKHYAPNHPLRLNAMEKHEGEVFLNFGPGFEGLSDLNLSPKGDIVEAASNLYAMIHSLDQLISAGIAVAPIPTHGLGLAINDRLKRAAS